MIKTIVDLLTVNIKSILVSLAVILSLLGCQITEPETTAYTDANPYFYNDDFFLHHKQVSIETEEEIFALDEEMQALVSGKLKLESDIRDRARKLLKHIFSEENIGIAYNSHANLTARQAFHAAEANCMSLTVMSYALARAADIPVKFQQVYVPEYWVRNGAYNMLTGHVNLRIDYEGHSGRNIIWGSRSGEIDFDPFISKQSFSRKVVKQNTIVAMFYNNKGAQALADHNFDAAYAYLKAATKKDPTFGPAWGNLGILYRFTGNLYEAEQVYLHTLQLDKKNLTSKTNLALLYRYTDREVMAEALEAELALVRAKNPYYHAMLADEAMYKGEIKQALGLTKRALRLDKNNHEFYLLLAKVYFLQDKLDAAQRAMQKAISINKSPDVESRYIAKLNFLKNAEVSYP